MNRIIIQIRIMADLIALLRNNECIVKYSKQYDANWDDEELLDNVIELDGAFKGLTSLPQLPNCTYLLCSHNQLTSLPQLPNCIDLICYNNQLISLPQLPNCRELFCSNNQLTSLPKLVNCQRLYCYDNQITSLPQLPNIQSYDWSNNCLPFYELDKWIIVWKVRRLYLQIKYFRLWYKFMLHSKARVKAELHNELKYSPDLQFYKNTEEYDHWTTVIGQIIISASRIR